MIPVIRKCYLPFILLFPVFSIIYITTEFSRQYQLVGLVLLLTPLFDKYWRVPLGGVDQKRVIMWLATLMVGVIAIVFRPKLDEYALLTLIFTAIPEEWFFRAYLMTRLGVGLWANILASIAFSLMHVVSHGGVTALLVFFPSLIYGWLYQKTNDLIIVMLLHAVSNVIYIGFLNDYFIGFINR